jgi:hypothetical protein
MEPCCNEMWGQIHQTQLPGQNNTTTMKAAQHQVFTLFGIISVRCIYNQSKLAVWRQDP